MGEYSELLPEGDAYANAGAFIDLLLNE